jgi:hypothetical protein
MESQFKSMTLFDFQSRFPNEDSCYKYLSELKWTSGYKCKKCGHQHYCKGVSPYSRQCTSCRYIESPLAGTLFHRCKFSILLAFYIVYYTATSKKGIASTELSRKLGLRQKTCWAFKMKVMRAMRSSKKNPIRGKVDVDETYVGGQDDQAKGRNEGKKKIVVVAVERKGRGISRFYGKVIDTASRANLKSFMGEYIDQEAEIRTDKWTGYKGLNTVFPNLKMEKSEKKGQNFRELHRTIMMFKAWLRGIHHNVNHLQAYIDEYSYRFNRHKMKTGLFENLIKRMVENEPYPYKLLLKH